MKLIENSLSYLAAFQDEDDEHCEDSSTNELSDAENTFVELIPYESDSDDKAEDDQGEVEHGASTSLQLESVVTETKNNDEIPLKPFENDVASSHGTLLDTIKCEIVSILPRNP